MKAAELFVEEIKIYQKYYTKPIYSEELARIREIFNTTNVNQRIEVRNQAKRAKRYEEADRIRDELTAMGIVLHDTKEATTWELKR
jgi:cysteinyl-tRNA synthetase